MMALYLVERVNRTEAGQTKMQIKLPISLRAGMAALSKPWVSANWPSCGRPWQPTCWPTLSITAMAVPPEVTPLPALETRPRGCRPRRSGREEAPLARTEALAVAPVARKPRTKKEKSK